jgi:MFS transporter, DHA3 family, macrolide efflux protein
VTNEHTTPPFARAGPGNDRSFVLLWQGQSVSQIGTQLFQVVAVLCVKQITESATLIGCFLAAYAIPNVLLGPLSGVLADRYSRRKLLIAADLCRGLVLISLAFLLLRLGSSSRLLLCLLFVYSAMEGVFGSVWQAAGLAAIPDIVPSEKLAGANSILQGSFQVCTVAAQAAAGILFRLLSTPILMIIDAASYFYAAVSSVLMKIPRTNQSQTVSSHSNSVRSDLWKGLRHINDRPGMGTVFYTMAFFQLLMAPMVVLFPFYVPEQLHAGPQWYGFLLAASGSGSLVGYSIGGMVRVAGDTSSRLILASTVLMSLLLASLVAITHPWIALFSVAGVGATSGFNSVKLLTIFQLATPAEMRGRVFGVLMSLTQGLAPIAMALTGVLVDLIGKNVGAVYLSCGVAAAALSLNIIFRRECRGFLAGKSTVIEAPQVAVGD